jgi:O-antigen ligase
MGNTQSTQFSKELLLKLILFSIIRYLVFTTQFYLIYNALSPQNDMVQTFMSIAAYFMLTSLIPMISFIEPAIRAAIALFVFNNAADNTIIVVLSSTFVWIINVVIPSIIGYIIILKEKIDFKSTRAH